jgi:hypothetical protein
VNRGALPLTAPSGKSIDVLAWCRGLKDNVPHEQPAVMSQTKGKAREERKLEDRDDTMLAWITAKLLLGLLRGRVAAAKDGDDATSRPGARQAWTITSRCRWSHAADRCLSLGASGAG